jgi:hypothetical protein
MQPFAWEALKRVLRSKEVRIESLAQQYSLVSTTTLEPEPIPIDIKVVLIGERILYYLLYHYDPDFKELFQLLNANGVRYLIIDGYAVAYHGYPRYTKDIDIWIWVNPDNAERVVKTLQDFGFESLGLKTKDFLETDTIIQLGHTPNRIDLIMGAPGVDFEESFATREEEEIEGVKLNFINLVLYRTLPTDTPG